ncbi:pyridoxine/pyridoxamine 5'-phosphate oxidase [Drosophila guanche]|uniref:pyridoxal 5'-phosphate synthase n=1 Tax=Drosophila guanche TaxID=7266 RepID=A0A3B0K0N7_DROGU|nr:pyridoxine/pyridoxamine 5'-phosphate oxidase [Drosophila guanche]SPP86893.1 blast:Pyridoxine/pyridoxamine 5'-phosphate oxidase [Drosophila guanche]
MAQTSALAKISDPPIDPVQLFKHLIETAGQGKPFIEMNLATIDEEFGVLNRTVVYRGLSSDNHVFYITHRYTRNCKNLQANPKACLTFYLPLVKNVDGMDKETLDSWQVRLIGATAVELPESEMDALWAKEDLPAKIRGHVFPCGEPVDYEQQKAKHDGFLNEHLSTGRAIERPATYTGWKFQPQLWDFLKVGQGQIADRVQYRLQSNGKWQSMHVAT